MKKNPQKEEDSDSMNNSAIMTRGKIQKLNTSSDQKKNELYPNLMKYDESHKEKKTLLKEGNPYRSPRISREKYQVNLEVLNKCKELPKPPQIVYDLKKVSPEDLAYYEKFIDYYEKNVGMENIFLKGMHSVGERAMEVLKDCDYDIHKAMSKILFPTMDQLGYLGFKEKKKEKKEELIEEEPIIEPNERLDEARNQNVAAALNDLIGASEKEKQTWRECVIESLEKRINLTDLQTLIENGKKMKIEIPISVMEKIKESEKVTNALKGMLSRKENTIEKIKDFYDLSKTCKVQNEYFKNVGELIAKAIKISKSFNKIIYEEVNFRTLQKIYNECKTLPFKFDSEDFEDLKTKYESAVRWYDFYNTLPKHSKTRGHKKNGNERVSLADLKTMVDLAHKIKFTSEEVEDLKNNISSLEELEGNIRQELKDKNNLNNKDFLRDSLNILDNLKFTTTLYDELEKKEALLEWKEKKDFFINQKLKENLQENGNGNQNKCFMKMKHFTELIQFAQQKNLMDVPEIIEFNKIYNSIFLWLDKMSALFNEKNNFTFLINQEEKNSQEEEMEEEEHFESNSENPEENDENTMKVELCNEEEEEKSSEKEIEFPEAN
ncbi:MAG: hypothetical protein MJ252_27665, partial [archaeon]|nr:hypothetical protein [archaeon]